MVVLARTQSDWRSVSNYKQVVRFVARQNRH